MKVPFKIPNPQGPCPCGSGQTFEECCLSALEAETPSIEDFESPEEAMNALIENGVAIVEEQLRTNEPEETVLTFQRLKKLGLAEEVIKEMIAAVLLRQLFEMIATDSEFDLERYCEELDELPELPEIDIPDSDYMMDRSAIIVSPKQPFVDWVYSLNIAAQEVSSKDIKESMSVYLIEEVMDDKHFKDILKDVYTVIFEEELASWSTDESRWPEKRNLSMFKKWFSANLQYSVVDLVNDDFI